MKMKHFSVFVVFVTTFCFANGSGVPEAGWDDLYEDDKLSPIVGGASEESGDRALDFCKSQLKKAEVNIETHRRGIDRLNEEMHSVGRSKVGSGGGNRNAGDPKKRGEIKDGGADKVRMEALEAAIKRIMNRPDADAEKKLREVNKLFDSTISTLERVQDITDGDINPSWNEDFE